MRNSRRGFRLKGLKRYESGGVEYVYHRASGTRLPDLPENDPKFIEAYLAAEAQPHTPKRNGAGSLEFVVSAYMHCTTFKSYSQSYRALMRRECAKMIAKAGHVPFHTIQRKHIANDLAALQPNAANKRLKAWRGICKHAVTFARDDDPTEGLSAKATTTVTGHTPWANAEITAFREHYQIETPERLAFELIFWTGARMSDAVRLGAGMVCDQGWLSFHQQKTGGAVSIPLRRSVPEFAAKRDLAFLHKAIANAPKHLTFMTTSFGASRSHKGASQWFARAARSAGITNRTAHGLRKSRAISLAERGATTHQIGAWTGHESLAEIEHYSRTASKKRLLSGVDSEQNCLEERTFRQKV